MKVPMSALSAYEFSQHIGQFNDRKFGKHRRGTVRIGAIFWADGVADIQFTYNCSRFMRIYDHRTQRTYRFAKYALTDFRKLLRS